MQVESFRKIEGNAYATTMCIGNLRSGMEHLYRWHVTQEKAHLHRAGVLPGDPGLRPGRVPGRSGTAGAWEDTPS
ncbi:MAG: YoaK family protein [Oscillospiraceae bacterium]